MRVLLLNYEFPPAGGGAGSATRNIGRQLVRLGAEVDVLTARIEDEDDCTALDGVRVFRVPSWRRSVHDCGLLGAWSWVFFAIPKRARLHRERNYDLEHFFFSLPTGALTLVPRGRPVPYLVSLRGSDVPGYDPFNVTLQRLHRLLKTATETIWAQAAFVVALSDGLRKTALETMPDLPMEVIPNGIEADLFRPTATDDRARQGGRLRILTVSRLLERKGIHHLLRAIAEPVPLDVEVIIAGTGNYEHQLRSLSSELKLTNRVRFLGFIKRTELPQLYRSADVFVLPSLAESFGLVFAEAMASGLPVVAGRVGGVPDLVRDGIDGLLVEPGNLPEIRRAVERLLGDRAARYTLGRSARTRVEEGYSWESVASSYLSLYERCLRRTPRPVG